MRGLIAVVAIVAAVCAAKDVHLSFEKNVNLTNVDKDFSFRFTSVLPNTFGQFNVLAWSSASVNRTVTNSSILDSATSMIGVGVLPSMIFGPFSFLAYGIGETAVNTELSDFVKDLVATSAFNSVFRGNVVALVPLNMQEVDSEGEAVGKEVPFTASLLSPCNPESITGADESLNGYTCTYAPKAGGPTVTITYVTSKDAGVVEYGNTPVSPRSFELIVEVKDFNLTSADNHVRMNVALVTASGKGVVDGNAVVFHREGKEDLYAAVSKQAVVEDKSVDVSVTLSAGNPSLDPMAKTLFTVAFGGQFETKVASVDFPAGASSFVYDPALGAGVNVYTATSADGSSSSARASSSAPAKSSSSGASTVALSLLAALVSIVIYLF